VIGDILHALEIWNELSAQTQQLLLRPAWDLHKNYALVIGFLAAIAMEVIIIPV
jgi:hypothetical protein